MGQIYPEVIAGDNTAWITNTPVRVVPMPTWWTMSVREFMPLRCDATSREACDGDRNESLS
jgi:hypothetical protein